MPDLTHDDYTIGCICSMGLEMAAVVAMFDNDEHPKLPTSQDQNAYFLGRIGRHNIVVATLPDIGTGNAATVAAQLCNDFPSIRFGLLVGLGGGVPGGEADIRLGDVVVSLPTRAFGGLVHFALENDTANSRFQRTGALNEPSAVLRKTVETLLAQHERFGNNLWEHGQDIRKRLPKLGPQYLITTDHRDVLFKADYPHSPRDGCDKYGRDGLVKRAQRRHMDPVIHYGTIGSSSRRVGNGKLRERLRQEMGIICVETDATGLMDTFPCLVIRGISDYADSHINRGWQRYAAEIAAAYMKELLMFISAKEVEQTHPVKYAALVQLTSIDSHVQGQKGKGSRHYENDHHRLCHLSFKTSSYDQFKDYHPQRMPGTCRWILKNEKYQQWSQENKDGLLWISAGPGWGKSVLAKSLVENELRSSIGQTTCHFFFKYNEEQNSLATALNALLYQLFDAQPYLLRHAIEAWNSDGQKLQFQVQKLWQILIDAATSDDSHNVMFVIDGLDECRDDDRWRLIDMLSRFHTKSSSSQRQSCSLKILVTGRPSIDIQRRFHRQRLSMAETQLRGDDGNLQLREEINMVTSKRVSDLAERLSLKPDTKTRLEQKLLRVEHRTHLWLHLAFHHVYDTLKDSLWPDDEVVDTFPSSVEDAYEKMLKKVTSMTNDKAKFILQVVVGARRPLTVGEMALALELLVSSHLESVTDFQISKYHPERRIRGWGGSLIFINNSKIYLVHQTARDFLIYKNYDTVTSWNPCLDKKDIETCMSQMCVRFLLLKDFKGNVSEKLIKANKYELRTEIQKKRKNDIENLMLYSAEHWPDHVRKSNIWWDGSLMTRVHRLCDSGSEQFQLWFPLFWSITNGFLDQPEMNSLRLAAFNGHDAVVSTILADKDVDIDEADRDNRTALQWASAQGHEAVVGMLLNRGAKIDTQDRLYDNALQAASRGGHEAVVQLLLISGADINAQGGRYDRMNALQAASRGGHKAVVEMLLNSGAKIDNQGGLYGSALQAASRGGHEAVVQLLLISGADINMQGGRYGNALQAASRGGYEAVVQILLNKGAKIDAQGGLYGNALQAASKGDHKGVVHILRRVDSMFTALTATEWGIFEAKSRGAVSQPANHDGNRTHLGDDDIASIMSVEDTITSFGAIRSGRNSRRLEAEFLLSRAFAKHDELGALCKDALTKVPRHRFVENFRRLLGLYHLDLIKESVSLTEKECANLVQNQIARTHIASELAESIDPTDSIANDQSTEKAVRETQGTEEVERWLTYVNDSSKAHDRVPEIIPYSHTPADYFSVEEESTGESEPLSQLSSLETPNFEEAKTFLLDSVAFQRLLGHTQAFLIPIQLASLCRILTSIPSNNIQFTRGKRRQKFVQTKIFLERMTDSKWDWWPLQPPESRLSDGCVRIRWQCHCSMSLWQDVTEEQATALQNLLRLRGTAPDHDNHLCHDTFDNRNPGFNEILASLQVLIFGLLATSTLSGGIWNGKPIDVTVALMIVCGCLIYLHEFSARWRLSHSDDGTDSASTAQQHCSSPNLDPRTVGSASSTALQSKTDSSKQQASQGRDNGGKEPVSEPWKGSHSLTIPPGKQSWILFGLTVHFECFKIKQLDTRPIKIKNDDELFRLLRASHASMKSLFRRLFSVWQLNHCDVVKFTKPEANHIFRDHKGPDLPSKEHINDHEFDSQGCSLTVHEFEAGLNSCRVGCRLTPFHQCVRQRTGRRALERIPKKRTLWPIQTDSKPEEAWGLRAREVPSALRVTVYRLLILLGPFGFWLWRLCIVDNNDWQNASVPAAIVISLQALFWTQLGILKLISEGINRT